MSVTSTPKGSTLTRYSTFRGDAVEASVSPGKTTETLVAHSKGRLPSYTRTPTQPGPDKLTYHSEKKGPKGGRQYNPDDTHVRHKAPSVLGIPAVPGSGNSILGSAQGNQEDSRFERKALAKIKESTPTVTTAEVKKTKLTDPDYRKAVHEAFPQVDPARADRRLDAYVNKVKQKGQGTPLVLKSGTRTISSPNGTVYGSQTLTTDTKFAAKEKWSRSGYDADNSSGDEDIEKGK